MIFLLSFAHREAEHEQIPTLGFATITWESSRCPDSWVKGHTMPTSRGGELGTGSGFWFWSRNVDTCSITDQVSIDPTYCSRWQWDYSLPGIREYKNYHFKPNIDISSLFLTLKKYVCSRSNITSYFNYFYRAMIYFLRYWNLNYSWNCRLQRNFID